MITIRNTILTDFSNLCSTFLYFFRRLYFSYPNIYYRAKSISFPTSVKVINYGAFINCSNLKNLYYEGNKEQWKSVKVYSNNAYLTSAKIHYTSEKKEDSKPTPKKSQTISAKSFTKTYGGKSFKIGAKAKTKLSYKSGDNKVATVSSSGKVTIKGIGKVTITITAKGNSVYKPATKKITITINPKPVTKITVKTDSKKSAQISWSKPAKVSGCQISFSYKKNFKEGERIDQVLYKNKILYKGIKRNAYFRIRTFTKYKNVKYYSSWTVKAIKFK